MHRILLADDSKTIQKILRLSLPEDQYQLDCFDEAVAARSHLARFGADLVLVDAGIPGGGGYEFCRQLKRGMDTSSIPVVLLGGGLVPIDGERLAWAGADASLTKPIDASNLLGLIEEMIQLGHRSTEAPVEVALPTDAGVPREVPEVQGRSVRSILALEREECRPRFRILAARTWRRPAARALTEEQFQAILKAVSEQLPQTLRDLLPEVAGRVLGRQPS